MNKIPALGDLVIGEITKMSRFGAYCKLLEYDGLEVFIPLKEISSGWIKNIHEFLHVNQRVVCKVIYIDRVRDTIDVSIKKVKPRESKIKINDYNLEKRSYMLTLQAIKMADQESMKDKILGDITSRYPNYTSFLQDLSENPAKFQFLPKEVIDNINNTIEASKVIKEHIVSYIISITEYDNANGINEIKDALITSEKDADVNIYYISSPKYHLSAKADTYPEAEAKVNKAVEIIKSKLPDIDFKMDKEKLKRDKEDIISTL